MSGIFVQTVPESGLLVEAAQENLMLYQRANTSERKQFLLEKAIEQITTALEEI